MQNTVLSTSTTRFILTLVVVHILHIYRQEQSERQKDIIIAVHKYITRIVCDTCDTVTPFRFPNGVA